MPEIEIARTGRFTDANGITKEFTPEFLEEVASSYNPKLFKAPLIVTHNTKGIDDDKLADSELAFGAPSSLKVVGDRLKAVFDKVSPKIVDHFRNGELLSISPSFYPPTNRNNPSLQFGQGKGRWMLRHIAALGRTSPSIKGLTPVEFAETGYNPVEHALNFSFPVELTESDETLEFSIASYGVRSLFNNLRDWLIEKHGREETDKILPSFEIEELTMGDRSKSLNDFAVAEQRQALESFRRFPAGRAKLVAEGNREQINMLMREINDLKSQVASYKSQVERSLPSMMYEEADGTGSFASPVSFGDDGTTVPCLARQSVAEVAPRRIEGYSVEGTVAHGGTPHERPVQENSTDILSFKDKDMKKHKGKHGTTEEIDKDIEDVVDEEDLEEEEEMPPVDKKTKKNKTTDMNEEPANAGAFRRAKHVGSPEAIDYAELLEEERKSRRLLELQFQNEQRKAEFERKARKEEKITSFCENLVKDGQLTAAQMGDRLLEFGEGESDSLSLPQFLMTLDDEQLSFMEDFLSTQPQQISFGEFAPDNEAISRSDSLDFATVPGAIISESSRNEFDEILQYCEKNSLDPDNSKDFEKAALAVLG